jgi:hypothetical protein
LLVVFAALHERLSGQEGLDPMTLNGASAQIRAAVLAWPGVTAHPHRFGGVDYRLGARELGHIHGDHLVDIPLPTRVRDEIVAAGLAEPHHILPDTGWVSLYLRAPGDAERAIELLRRSFDLARRKWSPAQEREKGAEHAQSAME